MDDAFEYFLTKFGPPIAQRTVDPVYAAGYRGVLPTQLLDYWMEHGWCGYADGLFWLVDPGDYKTLLDTWLVRTPLHGTDDYNVIARSAFGALFVWGGRTGLSLQISSPHSIIFRDPEAAEQVQLGQQDLAIKVFLSGAERDFFDVSDFSGKPLFKRALKKLGKVGPDTAYGFEPVLVAGGKASLANLRIVDIQAYLEILAQFGEIRVLTQSS